MHLQKLTLRNIRSYRTGQITFPKGIIVLSGDIGAGKSTVLLAVEFALFGIIKGDISGSNLLRHGEKEGSVELSFQLDGKEIMISRTLKRGSTGIGQDAGYIIIDQIKTQGTAIELKSKMLEILGYPKDLLNKSKNLIYRYTVYTPQEDMKLILYENEKDRLDMLRRVFGIDKYQRVLENSSIVIKDMRDKKNELIGFSRDIDSKISGLKKVEEEFQKKTEELKLLKEPLEKAKEDLRKKNHDVEKLEEKIKVLQEESRKIAKLDAELSMNVRNRSEMKKDLEDVLKRVEKVEKPTIDIDAVHKRIAEIEIIIPGLEKEMKKANEERGAHRMKLREAEDLKGKLINLKECPFCRQEIAREHKERIAHSQEELEKQMNIAEKEVKDRLNQTEEKRLVLRRELQELERKEKDNSIIELRIKAQEELIRRSSQLKTQIDLCKETIASINIRKIELNDKISSLKKDEEEYTIQRKEREKLRETERDLSIRYATAKRDLDSLTTQMKMLKDDIASKEASRKKATQIESNERFITGPFKELVLKIERAVMRKAHTEFNELFIRWFDILIEDDTINVRLDGNFSPVIVQNGYESEISSLSGGEKTSLALAYRLALNKVINDILGTVKTKELIILDEPTDGFSSEQLDRMRDVLSNLGMEQIIIVSHESKIESYADKVIRIGKEDHASMVK